MLLDDFDYDLPAELIAQQPAERRDDSRLMLLDRQSGDLAETTFAAITGQFNPGDLLVINNTRVIPARLTGFKESGGRAEVFLVRRMAEAGEIWHCLIKSSKQPRPDSLILLPGGLEARVIERCEDALWKLSFSPVADFAERIEQVGQIPLPPYIKRPAERADRERYQTVFAEVKGAVAAPTAGLHMTSRLMEHLGSSGVEVLPLTLHVGLGTFMPVRVADLHSHTMHREKYSIPEKTAARINAAKSEGRRVIALGTTSARALEHAGTESGRVLSGEGEADIFIYPGYRFKVVDALITNYHLPKSTLLMMVAAFAGKDLLLHAYAEAVRRSFRFYSYGDAMFIY